MKPGGRELYVHLVNKCMELDGKHELSAKKPNDAEDRIVKEVEAHCALLPPASPEIDHYKPVEYLLCLSEDKIDKLPGLDEALDRFEKVFGDLNALID